MKTNKLLIYLIFFAIVFMVVFILPYCNMDTEPVFPPAVTTSAVTEITNVSATGGGTVTSEGTTSVTERGVCWNTTPGPTITDSRTSDGSGIGSFTSHIGGLVPNTPYYVRAFATNIQGTSYGSEVSFTTAVTGMLPTVTTGIVDNITDTSATCGGVVTAEGTSAVVAHGVCWSMSEFPDLSDLHTVDGSGTGSFTSNIIGLIANTRYYVRAYASNSEGTAYGNEKDFKTPGSGISGIPCPGIPTFTDPRDGQVYPTIQIGNQCWLQKNMNYPTGNSWCWDGDSSNCSIYGLLYDWSSALSACPEGWHLPSKGEWGELLSLLGNNAGGEMKEQGTAHWSSPNTGATNNSGFTALPGGFRMNNGSFHSLHARAAFWTSSEDQPSHPLAWYVYLVEYNAIAYNFDNDKTHGFSVRCLKD